MSDGQPLLDVAEALADGTPIDWKSAAHSLATDEDRRLLAELRFIAQMMRPAQSDSTGRPIPPTVAGGPVAGVGSPTIEPEPATWGPLRIIERVGGGSFGDVYRAWDSRLDREVALKILRQREDHDEVRASMIVQEGRLLARVRHPNVVTVYGAERIDGQVGVWMEFIHGKTLEQELGDGGPLAVERVIRIGVDLADALATVHRAGLVHGDVKSHNVMCGTDGRTVLTDFGAGFELDATFGEPRELAGTPVCIAPEVMAGQSATPSSDVYSLGVLLFHLVTGTYPVSGRSLKEISQAHAQGTRRRLSELRPDLPAPFARIVERALDPNPDQRYDSPSALGVELAAIARADTDAISPATVATSRTKWLWMTAALVVIGGIALLPFWRGSETPTIAVLPLENLSDDPSSEYFVDGLTDEIIRSLSVIDGLEVRSRTSSFAFKGKPRNLREVGQQLKADFIVEGSVLRADGRLRINAQFVRVAGDVPLWSDKFDRDLKDVFAVQEEISRSIVNELRLKLGRGQRRYNTNPETYDLYLKARAYGSPNDVEQGRIAADLFQAVIDKDPTFAPAYAGLTEAWAVMSINRFGVPADEAFAVMQPAAKRGLELDPLLAEAHAAMGIVYARNLQWREAEAAFSRAVGLNHSLSSIRQNFVKSTLWPQGKIAESLNQVAIALRTDPLSLDLQRLLAFVQVSAGQYEQSIAIGRRVLAAEPQNLHARQVLGRALFHHGEREEAIQIFEKLGIGSHNFRGYAYGVTGRRSEAEALAGQHQDFPARLVMIYAGLGDNDRVFESLERMAAEKHPLAGQYLTYPELAGVRDDPRMAAFRAKLRLPPRE